jgi:rhodanese-related sulfurtransferase
MSEPRTVDQLLAAARARLVRISAQQAAAEQSEGAMVVDTRTYEQRQTQGVIPGAVPIDRTVFEWRLDPASPWHEPEVADHDTRIIVVCGQGYSSSLAAASLQDLGLHRATDIVGGFEAWLDAGLPVEPFEPVRDDLP